MRYKAVVFDLDGTLVDSFRDIAAALNAVLKALGHPARDPQVVKRMIGGGARKLLERALEGPEEIEQARALFKTAYEQRLTDTTTYYPGITSMLERLRDAQIPALVATNKPAYFTERLAASMKLSALGVRAVASADEVPIKKPDPGVVWLALKRAGLSELSPDELAYVGDMPVDVQTARAIGCDAIGVSWGFDPEGLREAKPDKMSDNPGKLEAFLLGG